MFEQTSVRRTWWAALLCVVWCVCPAWGQDASKKGGSVPITFVPPPLENAVYSVGIYDLKTGKLARRLCEAAGQETFKVGLNGLITSWDGRDDDGKALPPGKYAARGYAVGPLEVEGVDVLGNDWAGDDEDLRLTRVAAIALVPDDKGLVVAGWTLHGPLQVARYGGEKSELLWKKNLQMPTTRPPRLSLVVPKGGKFPRAVLNETCTFRLSDGEQSASAAPEGSPVLANAGSGQNATAWKIEEGVLCQYAPDGERLRSLAPKDGDPVPVSVASSPDTDRIYLLEEAKGWQRVRGLAPTETREENGKAVSTWQTVFERNIRVPDPASGLDDPATAKPAAAAVEIALDENPLSPGKHPRAKFAAALDEKGSYLATADGLRLRQISQRAHLRAVRLAKDKEGGGLSFFQTDGAAWDQFSVRGARRVIEFDAGEFEIDAAGERPNAEKAPDPEL